MSKEVKQNLDTILQENMLGYGMINNIRSIGNIYDGLKPVQRRILYCMYEMGLFHNKPFKKVAAVAGLTIANFNPHSDTSAEDALCRMEQPYNTKYPYIMGKGNFGNITLSSNEHAASRYIECKLSKFAYDVLLEDIDKNAVDFVNNYDNSKKEPVVLPSKLPLLLLNGTFGIGYGYSGFVPPHNIKDLTKAVIEFVKNPKISDDDLYKILKPDFPTSCQIINNSELPSIYSSGKGAVRVRANINIEDNKIIISSIPYMTTVNTIKEKIQKAINNGIISGIIDFVDSTSDDNGVLITLKVNNNTDPSGVVDMLYKHCGLQDSFALNIVYSSDEGFKTLDVRSVIEEWYSFRIKTLKRIFNFKLNKYSNRLFIIEGLLIALADIDNIIKIIKSSKNKSEAAVKLIKAYKLSDIQVDYILDTKLHKLTSMSIEELKEEKIDIEKEIKKLNVYFRDPNEIRKYIIDELTELSNTYGDERVCSLTDIQTDSINNDVVIDDKDYLVVITKNFLIKKLNADNQVGRFNPNDRCIYKEKLSNKNNYFMIFTSKGRYFKRDLYEIKNTPQQSFGLNLLTTLKKADPNERIVGIIVFDKTKENHKKNLSLTFGTKNCLVKRSSMSEYPYEVPVSGIMSMKLKPGDELVSVGYVRASDNSLFLLTEDGYYNNMKLTEIPLTLKNTYGVKCNFSDKDYKLFRLMPYNNTSKEVIGILTDDDYVKFQNVKELKLYKRTTLFKKFLPYVKNGQNLDRLVKVNDKDVKIPIDDKKEITPSSFKLTAKGGLESIL